MVVTGLLCLDVSLITSPKATLIRFIYVVKVRAEKQTVKKPAHLLHWLPPLRLSGRSATTSWPLSSPTSPLLIIRTDCKSSGRDALMNPSRAI